MAATDEAIAGLAAALSVEETPVKLRCATCSQIAYNALRLPCCEQNICETCYNDLEDMCQVCHHEPLDKSLCTPNKSLRTTTKVFLKKKLLENKKKKADESAKAEPTPEVNSAPIPAPEAQRSAEVEGAKVDAVQGTSGSDHPMGSVGPSDVQLANSQRNESADGDIGGLQASIEVDNQEPAMVEHAEVSRGETEEVGRPQTWDSKQSKEESAREGQWGNGDMSAMMNSNGLNAMNGAFPMDFNQMMANGMQMPSGNFPNLMGMGMDQAMMNQMSQSMFGGFGGPNMGMSGMGANMGMGFNDQSQFGGPWMGQGAFNANGQSNTGYGGHSGYNMSSHQGNYNQMNQQQYSHNDYSSGYGGHGFRGRGGRGRRGGFYNGGYGRGYHSHNHNNYANHASNHAYQQQSYQAGNTAQGNSGSDSVIVSGQTLTAEEEEARMMKELAPGGEDDDVHVDREQVPTHQDDHDTSTGPQGDISSADKEPDSSIDASGTNLQEQQRVEPAPEPSNDTVDDDGPRPIQSFVSDEPHYGRNMPPPAPNVPLGPSGRGFNRALSQSSNGTTNISVVTENKGVGVVGAPTGPKALREGLPNTARSAFMARAQPPASMTPAGENEPVKSPSPVQRRSATRSPSRSPSRHRSEKHRSSRYRSRTRSPDSKYEKRDERERRHRRSYYYEEDERPEDDSSSKRSSHRSRRHHDRDRDSSTHSHRRHRGRSHDREKDKDRYYDHERERERRKDREYDETREERRQRRRRSRSAVDSTAPTPTSAYPPEFPNGDEGSRKRRSREDDYDRDYEREYERKERKRSRRDRSPTPERHSQYQSYSREASKPTTPATPSFPSSHSRRQSDIGNGVPGAPSGPSSKAIPTGPRASFSQPRRDRERDRDYDRSRQHSDRHSRTISNGHMDEPAPKIPEKDPHTLEREARDRERLMKEMQRRATMEGPKKKGSMNIRGSARRSSVKYEDDNGEDAMRVEREREGPRWR